MQKGRVQKHLPDLGSSWSKLVLGGSQYSERSVSAPLTGVSLTLSLDWLAVLLTVTVPLSRMRVHDCPLWKYQT